MQSISVLITGASGDIGLALYRQLHADERYECYVHFRNNASYERVKHEFSGVRTHRVFADLSDIDATRRMAARLPAVDVLINNAGHFEARPFLDTPFKDIERQLTINYLSPLLLAQVVAKSMQKHGRGGKIINLSSGSGVHGGLLPSFGYAAGKNGLNFMAEALTKELAPHNIAITTVVLRFVQTKMLESYAKFYESYMDTELRVDSGTSGITLYRPEEIASRLKALIEDAEPNDCAILEIA